MAATRITDIIEPSVFNDYVIQRTATLSALRQSGIISQDVQLDALAASGGRTINMPFWNDLTGTSEVLSQTVPLTVNAIGADKDIAVLFMRGKAWGANDLAKAVAGADPMRAVGDLVSDFWMRDEQTLLINILTGVFLDNAANDASDLISDISIVDGSAVADSNRISGEAVLDAAQKLGDAKSKLTAIAMHSIVESKLAKKNLITTVKGSDGVVQFKQYMGMTVIVDDGCPVVATGSNGGYYYTTYLFGQGAIGRGDGAAPMPVEVDRDSLQGDDILVNRRHFILHPRGIAWQAGSMAGASPTNAEAALAANWSRAYAQKNIRIVKLVTNG